MKLGALALQHSPDRVHTFCSPHLSFWTAQEAQEIFCLLRNYLYSATLSSCSHFVQKSVPDGGAQCCSGDQARERAPSGSSSLENPYPGFALPHGRAGSYPFLRSPTARFQLCFPVFLLAGSYTFQFILWLWGKVNTQHMQMKQYVAGPSAVMHFALWWQAGLEPNLQHKNHINQCQHTIHTSERQHWL